MAFSSGIAKLVAGVDEVGRGPLAGPVVAAAVILDETRPIEGLADSKTLSAHRRQELSVLIKEHALCWALGRAEVEEIDRLNILQASLLAMQRAAMALSIQTEHVLVDGNQAPRLTCPVTTVVRGDATVPAISAATIIAKVERDAKNSYINYDMFLPKTSKLGAPFSADPNKVAKFNPDEHIRKKKVEPMQEFGSDSGELRGSAVDDFKL